MSSFGGERGAAGAAYTKPEGASLGSSGMVSVSRDSGLMIVLALVEL